MPCGVHCREGGVIQRAPLTLFVDCWTGATSGGFFKFQSSPEKFFRLWGEKREEGLTTWKRGLKVPRKYASRGSIWRKERPGGAESAAQEKG